jgi:hypothetical protein
MALVKKGLSGPSPDPLWTLGFGSENNPENGSEMLPKMVQKTCCFGTHFYEDWLYFWSPKQPKSGKDYIQKRSNKAKMTNKKRCLKLCFSYCFLQQFWLMKPPKRKPEQPKSAPT